MPEWWNYIMEVIGVGAASISGAMVAIERKLDLFGIYFLGMITAFGGGVLRDLLIGQIPPRFFTGYFALVIVLIAVSCVVIVAVAIKRWRDPSVRERFDRILNLFDAVGLAAFAVMGVQMAIKAGYADNGFLCVFMGMTTGIGGGALRDVLTQHTPYIFKKRIYALAAILGATLYWLLYRMSVSLVLAQIVSVILIVAIRICATVFRWNLPRFDFDDRDKAASSLPNHEKAEKDPQKYD